ncbi:MAG TPA: long-chain fatty acid--CoA ligase [Kofleriaceae bacterium]
MPTPDTIPHRLLEQAKLRPSGPAYYEKTDGSWSVTSWRDYAATVRTCARALIALGFAPKSAIAILGFNRPEWVLCDLAAMMAGGAPAGIYTSCSPEQIKYIVSHSEAPIILVENQSQLAKVLEVRSQLPSLRHIVLMRGASVTPSDTAAGILTWEQFLAKASETPDSIVDERLAALEPDGLATLIYTSGTTGPPKGVMLSHDNLAWTAHMLSGIGSGVDTDVSLSYLPLAHIAEQMATIANPVTVGSSVYFAESLEKIADNLKDARPTVFFGVPRIWEKFHAALSGKLGQLTGTKAKLVAWARSVNTKVNNLKDKSAPIPFALDLQYKLAAKLVMNKLKAAMGFDRGRWLISGAAPIAADVLEFFHSIDLPIREIYGQSEDCGPTSSNLPNTTRIGTVGVALPGLEVKIAEDGEILVRGPNVFLGYYKDAQATDESVLVDTAGRWLRTGDLGAFDTDGYLSITGRKKEIIITAGGKNIAPKNIEAALKQSPLIGEAVVIGDRRKYLTALVTLADGAGAPDTVRAAVQAQVDVVNKSLSRVEQVKRFSILARPFGIETGELTPTLKIKRKVVSEKYAAEIDAMYSGQEAAE